MICNIRPGKGRTTKKQDSLLRCSTEAILNLLSSVDPGEIKLCLNVNDAGFTTREESHYKKARSIFKKYYAKQL